MPASGTTLTWFQRANLLTEATVKQKSNTNARKQQRYRDRQRQQGKRLIRGYISPKAIADYHAIMEKTDWTDNDLLNNAIRITYAAYKLGQMRLINNWIKEQDKIQQKYPDSAKADTAVNANSIDSEKPSAQNNQTS